MPGKVETHALAGQHAVAEEQHLPSSKTSIADVIIAERITCRTVTLSQCGPSGTPEIVVELCGRAFSCCPSMTTAIVSPFDPREPEILEYEPRAPGRKGPQCIVTARTNTLDEGTISPG